MYTKESPRSVPDSEGGEKNVNLCIYQSNGNTKHFMAGKEKL